MDELAKSAFPPRVELPLKTNDGTLFVRRVDSTAVVAHAFRGDWRFVVAVCESLFLQNVARVRPIR